MEKYQNKYRIKSARLKGYDYGNAGLYFITICTANREYYFGEIIEEKMQLSNIGIVADVFWHEIRNHSKNIELHQFMVMPNHIHGILEIVEKIGDHARRDVACNVSTGNTIERGKSINKCPKYRQNRGQLVELLVLTDEVLIEEDLKNYLLNRYTTEQLTEIEAQSIILQLKTFSSADLYESNNN